ncbi:hypothetical protein Tco_1009001 [Tanacetum coccineum]
MAFPSTLNGSIRMVLTRTVVEAKVHIVQALNFDTLTEEMRGSLPDRLRMEHPDAQGQVVFTSHDSRRLFETRGPLVHELILEFFSTFRIAKGVLDLDAAGTLQFQLGGHRCGVSEHPLLAGIVFEEICFREEVLTVVAYDLLMIDMDELVRLRICDRLGDTRAWVEPGPERQHDAMAGGVQAPPTAAPTPRTMSQRMTRLEEEVHGLRESLGKQRAVLDGMSRDFSSFVTWMVGHLS